MRESFLHSLLRSYSRILHKYKYATQITTGGLLWFSGDLLCQSLVHSTTGDCSNKDGDSNSNNSHENVSFPDWKRTARMTCYGICVSAPAYAFWYTFLDMQSQRLFTTQPGRSLATPRWLRFLSRYTNSNNPLGTSLTFSAARLRTWKIIGYKLVMDTLVFDPIYLTLFFTATSTMEGKSFSGTVLKLREELGRTWLIDVAIWTPIQAANFRFVPVLYQALVVQSCNVGWNAFLSFVQHRSATENTIKEVKDS